MAYDTGTAADYVRQARRRERHGLASKTKTLTARVNELEDQNNRFRELFENVALEILRFSGDAKFSEWVDQHQKDAKENES